MQRLTKAAMATGAAAVLLLGGAGTMAYWTGDATTTKPPATLTSGTFTASGTDCSASGWTYVSPGTGAVTTIVPGDVVTTTCTFNVTGTGDHIALNGATVSNPVWENDQQPLPLALGTAKVTQIQVGSNQAQTPDSNGQIGEQALTSGTATPVTVTIQVTFDYNNNSTVTTDGSQVNAVNTQAAMASLDNITVTFQQGNSAYKAS